MRGEATTSWPSWAPKRWPSSNGWRALAGRPGWCVFDLFWLALIMWTLAVDWRAARGISPDRIRPGEYEERLP